MSTPALTERDLAAVDALLADDDRLRLARYPGDPVTRQPVHTVYVPADRVHAGLVEEWSDAARAALAQHAPTADALAAATGLDPAAVAEVWPGLTRKLAREPIEDLRVDLEDGYGARADSEEDRDAIASGRAMSDAAATGGLPPYCGVRFKSLQAATRRRGIRSLDLVLGSVLSAVELPDGWVQTLPKVTSSVQVSAMVELCGRLEHVYGLPDRRLRFEIQVETSQAILGPDGEAGAAAMVQAADGRCTGLHFGTYDYTAALDIAGGYQAMDHPAADHAKAVMQVAAAGTRARVSDGSTNVLPVGDTSRVHGAWQLHARLVRRSLERGFYQGWDLHPAQLPTRFLSTYLFFRRDHEALATRLRRYLQGADSGVLDEPATAQALAAFLMRGVHCGAVDGSEVTQWVGADLQRLTALAQRHVG
ncbi:MAG: aldolase [Actinomycetota bacterium]|nr:aldolase [Actinomycetota bacterium]